MRPGIDTHRGPVRSIIKRERFDSYVVDMNDPSSPGFSERNRQKITEIAPGMLKIDTGCEGS